MSGDFLMEKVLEVYFPECRYLKSCEFNYPKIKGEFEIPSSCYIKSTGHFNAVEAIICYNQLAYTFFAHTIKNNIEEIVKLNPGSFDEFSKERQLPDSYIVKIDDLRFKKPIDSSKFYANLHLIQVSKMGKAGFLKTKINFWDNYKGESSGEVLLAFITRINTTNEPKLCLATKEQE
jgi:hypothetical protein